MKRIALVVVLAGCRSSGEAPPPRAATGDAVAMVADAAVVVAPADAAAVAQIVDAAAPDAPVDAPKVVTGDDQFRDAVRDFAKARHRLISAWGTLHLDGSAKPYRFANLSVDQDADGNRRPDAAHDGAYLLEQAPDRYWLVTYWWNAASFHVADGPATGEPTWVVLDDEWIHHEQMHNHGKAKVDFALRDGELVELYDDDYNSRLDNDTVENLYARDGKCFKRCPPLAKSKMRGQQLPVSGPAKRIDLLVEPPVLF